eukprot:TRINITY_DN4900_c0_g3_i1.p1 TRINITY_DN4900_c0_g3~~TRINITY_DN4900_c0_g3_i1.p1  ORF type:complete len:176 (+),score=32.83 TRINITY_DN4900_c0_g3_i1:474-1001(+)
MNITLDPDKHQPTNVTDTAETRHQNYQELLELALDNNSKPSRPSKLRLSYLQVLMRSKQTLIANFGVICDQMHRAIPHVMLYMTTELGTSASVKGDGCGLVLRGRFKPSQVEVVLKKYCNEYVKCLMCGSFATDMNHDSTIRSNVQCCQNCHASRTLNNISQPTYKAQIGRRPRA